MDNEARKAALRRDLDEMWARIGKSYSSRLEWMMGRIEWVEPEQPLTNPTPRNIT